MRRGACRRRRALAGWRPPRIARTARLTDPAPPPGRFLLLLRHAKSAWPEGVADHDRPLAPRGRRAAPLVAAWLRGEGLVPDRALVSDARRTVETHDALAAALGLGALARGGEREEGERASASARACVALTEPRAYDAAPGDLLAVLRERGGEAARLLLVAHNPGTAELALALAAARGDADAAALARLRAKVPTAALAVFAVDGPWAGLAPGAARLVHYVTPALLGGVDED